MPPVPLPDDITIKARRFAVGLSGGADSTYLSIIASQHERVVLVHINHELRGSESDADEQFCRDLAIQLNRPLIVVNRSEIEPAMANLPTNPSARYRAIRLHVFRQVVDTHGLDAVLLAHHANDQAETVLMRLARGGGLGSLRGMQAESTIHGLRIERPLLSLGVSDIRSRLRGIDQSWREDSSNASDHYRRNVARALLRRDASLVPVLCDLANRAQALHDRLNDAAPHLPERFPCDLLRDLPPVVGEHAARKWLIERGCPSDDVSPDVCRRLIEQATDPAAPLRQHYPGKILVRRKKKHIERA